jgi:hypothetical protein
MPLKRGSLTVVGTGVTPVLQVTLESAALLRQADRVFYLVTDPLAEAWLKQLNASAVSLADLYGERKPRQRTYREMTDRIVSAVREGHRVSVAFYGHPGVLVEATHAAIKRLRREGYEARMTPGVSADGCLYADLGINPGVCGVQSFEATDFLLSRRRFDATSILLLWQIGVLGESTARLGYCRPERLRVLVRRLRRTYPAEHPVVLYGAARHWDHPPTIDAMLLRELPARKVDPLALLYVPPLPQRTRDSSIERWYRE